MPLIGNGLTSMPAHPFLKIEMPDHWGFHLTTAAGKSIMVFTSMKILLFWALLSFWMSAVICNAPLHIWVKYQSPAWNQRDIVLSVLVKLFDRFLGFQPSKIIPCSFHHLGCQDNGGNHSGDSHDRKHAIYIIYDHIN